MMNQPQRRLPIAIACAASLHLCGAAVAYRFAQEQKRLEALASQLTPFLMEVDVGDGAKAGLPTGEKDATGTGLRPAPKRRAVPSRVKHSAPEPVRPLFADNSFGRTVEPRSIVDGQNPSAQAIRENGPASEESGDGTAETGGNPQGDGRPAGFGVPGGTGSGGGLSQAPRLEGGITWDCPFPPEADDAGVDHAIVTLHVDVGPDGSVLGTRALKDPGHGFGREAEQCAIRKRWAPGRNGAGVPAAAIAIVAVKFDR